MNKYMKKGYALTLIGATLWAVCGVSAQYLFDNRGLTTDWLVPVRLLLAGIILVIIAAAKGKKDIFRIFKNKKDTFSLFIFAIMGVGACQYSYFTAISYSNAATATVLSYLSPVIIVGFLALQSKKMPRKGELLAVTLAIIGTVLISTHGDFTSLAISKEALLWGIFNAGTVAIYSIQPQQIIKEYGTETVTGWGMLIAGIILCVIFKPWHIVGTWDVVTFTMLGVIVVFGTVITFCFYLEGVKRIGPTKGSILATVEPIVSTVLAVACLGVVFQGMDFVGFALVIGTIFIIAFDKEKPKDLVE
ncbi:MAG: DMT family transporter [Anaerovoracaceae bacterium]